MTILVTGATGFIGQHFVRAALAADAQIVAVARRAPASPPHPNLRWLERGMAEVTPADVAGCDSFVHLAAHGVVSEVNQWDDCFRVNVVESLALWRIVAAAGIRRFVICGSCFEYGRSGERYALIPVDAPLEPTGAYHASKAAASMAALALAAEQRLDLTLLRPFHVFGEGEAASRLWPALREAAITGRDFPMTAGEQVRDFVPVERVADYFWRQANARRTPGQPCVENVGTGRPTTVRAFAERWWIRWSARGQLRIGALPYRPNEVMRYVPAVATPLEP